MQTPGTMPGRQLPIPARMPTEGVSRPPATTPQPGTPQQPGKPSAAAPPTIQTGATATPAPNLPPSLLDKPPAPAEVTLNSGSLSVDAKNSSLSDILKKLEASSGMSVDGFDKDSRVFGVYGPGPPRDVLSELLDGAGYNFLMVGATDAGTPRQIVLTARTNEPVSAPGPANPLVHDDTEDEPPAYPTPPVEQPPVQPTAMPPGEQRPRTPQEMLQELQRLRQQSPQQQQTQPNPQ